MSYKTRPDEDDPPSLADAAADVVDHSSLAFLLKASLSQRRKKEEEEEAKRVKMEQDQAVMEEWRERRKVLKAEFVALMALPSLTPVQVSRSRELVEALEAHDACKPSSCSSRRNKKRKLPRGGRTHSRQRQWYVHGLLRGSSAYAVSSPFCRQAQAAGHHVELVLRVFCTSRCVPPVVFWPRCLVGRPAARSASWPVWTRGTVVWRGRRLSLSLRRGSSPWFCRPW